MSKEKSRSARQETQLDIEAGLSSNAAFQGVLVDARRERKLAPRRNFARYECPFTGQTYRAGATIDWSHLSALVEQASADAGFGAVLPWNIGNMVLAGVAPGWYPRYASRDGADGAVEKVVRFCGWIRAAARAAGLSRLVHKTQSPRGMNSPHTNLNLWAFARRFPSPARLERKLWAVKRRAELILSGFERDYNPSWCDIAHALLRSRQVGKAAVIVAAETLSGDEGEYDCFRNYGEARDFLASIRTAAFPVVDNSDGVEGRRETEPRLIKFGLSVYRVRVNEKYGRFSLKWLVRTDAGRTFHSERSNPEEAIRDAIRAWKRQNDLERKEANLVSFLRGDLGLSPLITREDSDAAGNCRPGTESWVRAQGWSHRRFIPGKWLIGRLHDGQVRRVAAAARERRLGTAN